MLFLIDLVCLSFNNNSVYLSVQVYEFNSHDVHLKHLNAKLVACVTERA